MPITEAVVEQILAGASRSPSGVNSQPWQLVLLGRERAAAMARLLADSAGAALQGPQADMFRACGSLWPVAAAPSTPQPAWTDEQVTAQFAALDAPFAAICLIDRRMGHGSHLDYGMFIRSAQLIARERGIAVRALPAWQLATEFVREPLGIEPQFAVICALVFEEEASPAAEPPVPLQVEWR